MSGKSKLKCVFRSSDGEWVCCEDLNGKTYFFRTTCGKNKNYGLELKSGKVESSPIFSDYNRNGQPLTVEEKAYRNGFRACFAEMEKMKLANKKRSKKW